MDQAGHLAAAAVRIATPLLFAALGGIVSELSGVFAVGLEGMMLCGACAGTLATLWSGSSGMGLVAAGLGGACLAGAVVLVAVRAGADNMVTGLAANVLALGLTSFVFRSATRHGAPVHLAVLPPLHLGPLPDQPALTWAALLLVALLAVFLDRTQAGLRLRAVGENPQAAFAAGIDPMRLRMAAVLACGVLAGIGGAVLPLQQVGTFTDGMTGGRGYLALAAIIVGRWRPGGALAACLMFGAAEALALRVQIIGLPLGSYEVQMLPYVLALGVLAVLGRGARLPASIGRFFDRGR